MADRPADHSLFAECLAAMAVSGDAYPCDLLAPVSGTGCALPEPSPAPHVTTVPLRRDRRS